MPELERVLHIGPDVPGGMRSATRELFDSPLGDSYELEFIAAHRGSGAIRRLAIYLVALARLTLWSIGGRGRIVHIHATVRGSMYRKAVCVLLAKLLRRRVVFHIHSGPGDVDAFRARLSRPSLALCRAAFGVADVVISVSSASAAALSAAFGAEQVVVVPNAVPRFPPRSRDPDVEEEITAVYLGGFANPVKGGEVLLEAIEQVDVPGARIVLAGPGELPQRGRTLVDGPAPVEWRGWVDTGERDALLGSADVFVLASTSEGLPMALLEAMSHGLAIIATAVGGVPDVLEDGSEALIVPPGDPGSLGSALDRVLRDAELRQRLGRSALARSEQFGPAAVAERLAEIYRGLA